MTKARKVDLLYEKAKTGTIQHATPEELREIRKYAVGNSPHATKKNLAEYVAVVDKGYRLSFYDWCMNNGKADRRRRFSSKEDIAAINREENKGVLFFGWLTWGIALYQLSKGAASIEASAIIGMVISLILYKCARRYAAFTIILLPIVIAAILSMV